jgi:hypothetical protein
VLISITGCAHFHHRMCSLPSQEVLMFRIGSACSFHCMNLNYSLEVFMSSKGHALYRRCLCIIQKKIMCITGSDLIMSFIGNAFELKRKYLCPSQEVLMAFTGSTYGLHRNCIWLSQKVLASYTGSSYVLHWKCLCPAQEVLTSFSRGAHFLFKRASSLARKCLCPSSEAPPSIRRSGFLYRKVVMATIGSPSRLHKKSCFITFAHCLEHFDIIFCNVQYISSSSRGNKHCILLQKAWEAFI